MADPKMFGWEEPGPGTVTAGDLVGLRRQEPTIRLSTCRPDGRCPECGRAWDERGVLSMLPVPPCGCHSCPEHEREHILGLLTESLRQRDFTVRQREQLLEERATAIREKAVSDQHVATLRSRLDVSVREEQRLAEQIREERERTRAAIRERDLARAHDAQPYPTAEAYERVCAALKEAKAEALKWRRIRTPTHGSCCTCQGCGLDYESCRCNLDEACDRADRSEALLRRCRDTLREVRQTYGPEPGSRVIGLSAILSELDEALS